MVTDAEKGDARTPNQQPGYEEATVESGEMNAAQGSNNQQSDDLEQDHASSADYEREADLENLDRTLTRVSTISPTRGYLIIVLVVLTQLVQMTGYGIGINGAFLVARKLDIDPRSAPWFAAAYPLTQGSFVLMSGRLGTVYGHKYVLTIGCMVWVFWTLATSYSQGVISLSFFRALAGVGGGLMVPNAVALITINFPPSKQRNIALSAFGAMAPVGAAGGSCIGGIFFQWTEWYWLFFFLAVMGLAIFGAAIIILPNDSAMDPNGKMDWIGSYLGVAGLVLFNFVWNQAPAAGWTEPYEYSLLIVAILHFGLFLVWEARFATSPVLPFDIWKSPSFGPLMLVLFFAFMGLGIYIWYEAAFLFTIRGWDNVLVGCAVLPLMVFGTFAAFLAAWLVPRMPAQVIVAIGCTATAIINILIATTPRRQTYWAMIFPAMIVAAFTADLVFAASQIITSSIVPKRHQGAAGSLIGTLLSYGLSTGLGFAGTVEAYTSANGADPLHGIRMASWLGVGFAGLALVVNLVFVRMPKNTIKGWQGEDAKKSAMT